MGFDFIKKKQTDSAVLEANPGADIQAVPLIFVPPNRGYGDITLHLGLHAEGIYDYTGGQPLNLETITIDGKIYVYQDTLTNVDGNVHIGASAEASLDNLVFAINKSGGVEGTDYAVAMTLHPTVIAVKRSAVLLAVIVKVHGPSTIATLEGTTNITVDGANVGSVADALTITFAYSIDGITWFDDPTTTAMADAGAIARIFSQGFQRLRLTGNGPEHLTTSWYGRV